MAKKTKAGKKRHSLQAGPSQFDRMFASAVFLLEKEDYKGTVDICESILSYLPQRSPRRIDVLNALGGAQGALQNFPEAFAAFSEALDLDPLNADLWYNRG